MSIENCILFILFIPFVFGFQCINEQNNPVDWYVLYKLPKQSNSVNSLIRKGTAYLYITSETISKGWSISDVSINSTNSIPSLTLNPFYNDKTILSILYNDEPPDGHTSSTKGHTKGTIISSNNTGFWLIHSVPHFPPISKYFYPETGVHFGQSFLCISLNLSVLNVIGKQLQYYEPDIFSHAIPAFLEKYVPNLIDLILNKTIESAPWYNLMNFSSLNNQTFISFAKSRRFNKDLYADWMTVELKSNLLVETWPNGPGRLPSNCKNHYRVNNVKNILFQDLNINFMSTLDHSKWAISNNVSKYKTSDWICIGDINRAEHQKVRGGGAVCLFHPIWLEYLHIVNIIESCM